MTRHAITLWSAAPAGIFTLWHLDVYGFDWLNTLSMALITYTCFLIVGLILLT